MAARKARRSLRVFSSTLTVLALIAASQATYADSTMPTLIAPRYFVGDPLYNFQGPNGEIFSGNPDSPNGMASTTKIASLHVAVDALMGRIPGSCASSPAGFCTLGDWVTVSANAVARPASPWVPCSDLMGGCSSLMGDRYGEYLVLDTDQDGVYGSADSVLVPTGNGAPPAQTPLADDPRVTYVDANGNGTYDIGEWIVYDSNANGLFEGEKRFAGTVAPPQANPPTPLSDDPRLRYVDGYDPGTWNSYIPLQIGEQVQFADLLRGMMYPSGNDAAIALAEWVSGSVPAFVEQMNALTLPGHITAAGLPNTHFTNPAGLDNWCPEKDAYGTELHLDQTLCSDSYKKGAWIHYTTARDLARIWEHGFQDLLFRQIVGFPGPAYSFSTYLGGNQKQYRLGWGTNGYPGWDGGKGGSSNACGSGTSQINNLNCSIMSTKRIGRRLVIGLIGASYPNPPGLPPSQDDPTLALDYSFSVLFHPDWHGFNSDGTGWIDTALACLPDGRTVTATMSANHPVTLTTWKPNVDSSTITEGPQATLDVSIPPGRPLAADLEAIRLGASSVVTATTVGSPSQVASPQGANIKLSVWNIAQDGTPTPQVASAPAGAGTATSLLRINDSIFVSAFAGKQGGLTLQAWKVEAVAKGGLKLASLGSLNAAVPVDRVAVGGPFVVGALYYFVTASRRSDTGMVVDHLWSLDPLAGTIAPVASFNTGMAASSVSVALAPVEPRLPDDEIFAPIYFATAVRTPDGILGIQYSVIKFDFGGFKDFTKLTTISALSPILDGPSLVPFGTSGLVTAVKDAAGKQKLIVWESRRNPDDTITPYLIAFHEEPVYESRSIQACELPTTHAEADLFTSNLADTDTALGWLQVRAWRIGDRP